MGPPSKKIQGCYLKFNALTKSFGLIIRKPLPFQPRESALKIWEPALLFTFLIPSKIGCGGRHPGEGRLGRNRRKNWLKLKGMPCPRVLSNHHAATAYPTVMGSDVRWTRKLKLPLFEDIINCRRRIRFFGRSAGLQGGSRRRSVKTYFGIAEGFSLGFWNEPGIIRGRGQFSNNFISLKRTGGGLGLLECRYLSSRRQTLKRHRLVR